MPTSIPFTIQKDGGGDYTSIKSYVVAEAKDLVAADEVHDVTIVGAGWTTATPLSETFIDFAGFTTDATRRVNIVVQSADRHDFTAGTGFVFTISTSFGFVLRSKHVTLDGFEIDTPANTSNLFDTSANTLLKNSLIHGVPIGGNFTGVGENNIHWDYTGVGGNSNLFYLDGTATNVACHQASGEGGFNGDIGLRSVACTNVVVYTGKVGATFDTFFTCTGDYNAINKTGEGVPGANSFDTLVTGDFVNFGADNYISALGGALETSGFGGGFIGAFLEASGGGGRIMGGMVYLGGLAGRGGLVGLGGGLVR